jgi:hypothetical protein
MPLTLRSIAWEEPNPNVSEEPGRFVVTLVTDSLQDIEALPRLMPGLKMERIGRPARA